MSIYLFSVPLVPGKTENWKNYVREMQGPRNDEYKKSRKRHGLISEQVSLQQNPDGDIVVVRLKGENPQRSFENMIKSQDPFDTWFRDKIMIECHGFNMSTPIPQNTLILDYRETPVREYVETKKRG